MTSETGKKIISIHILPNILRSEDNQTMVFGQLIEYKMRNIFSKSYAKNVVKKLVSDSILSQNLAYLYINSPKFYAVYFFV